MKMNLRTSLLLAASLLAFPAFAEEVKPAVDAKAAADKADKEVYTPDAKPAVDKAIVAPAADDAKPASPAATSAKDYVIIKLDGEEIKNSDVQEIWKGLFQGSAAPDFSTFDENIKQNVLRGLVSERLIYKEATKSGFDKSEDVKKRIEALQKQLVMQAFIESKVKTLVTDEQIKAAYDEKQAANKGQEEVKARHILVASEDEAKKIAEELKKGGDFEKIAKEKSTDKSSGVSGGDLGWFSKDKMVPEFADAAFKLKKGEVSAPVKTAFGWHVIKLEERRPIQSASLDESKEAIRGELSNKAVQSYVEALLKSASIKYFDEAGKEKDFTRTLVAPKEKEEGKAEDAKPAKAEGAKPVEKK